MYTADAVRRWGSAVAVRGGRIAAVGAEADVLALRGPGTRVLQLDGGMVVPGFQDAHAHPLTSGLELLRCSLTDTDPGDYAAAITGWAADHPDAPWVLGGGWRMDAFPGGVPPAGLLDRLVPDRPVWLESRDGHSGWANAPALALAGVTAATADPANGRLERDPGGAPTGVLHEGAMWLVERLVPPPSADLLAEAIATAQAYLHRLGVTAWQDAWVFPKQLDAYRAAAASGALTARVVAALKWQPEAGEGQLAGLVEQRGAGSVGRLRATAVKIVQDGVFENFTAAMLEPYLGRGAERGISMLPAAELARVVTLLDAEGFDVHVHAIGDRAVREALDAFAAAAAANGRRDARHQIAHLQFVHPDDRPRFRRLGVVANAQPYWAVLDGYMRDLTLPFVSAERAAWQYPWASLRRAGATLAFGSDWSVSTPDPLALIEVAVDRVAPDDRAGEPFLPAERLDLPAALDAATIGAAYANRLDAATGSIEPGKLADLAVLDRDLFDPDAGPAGDARVLATLVEGEAVHADPSLGW
ncbi:MAG TPA: amidohydrolase [Actinomycetes bacterium]